ncbi:TetR family transcriptional regulator C-terminal domain-containing protein, partial [Bacillus sp. D-CC]
MICTVCSIERWNILRLRSVFPVTISIWGLTQNYADFATQMEMVTGKTLR